MSGLMIHVGDVREGLAQLAEGSVQCCVTSPPYWGLRDYGVAGQIGLEDSPEAFVETMVDVFRAVRRVLREDGTCWVNLGDSYNANTGAGFNGNAKRPQEARETKLKNSGLRAKNLIGIPWRVAFALQADGWFLRSDIIWHKPNPMPESVTDRPGKAHEYVFLLTKSARYFYDADAIRVRNGREADPEVYEQAETWSSGGITKHAGSDKSAPRLTHPQGANARSVWTIPSQPFPGAHFATFPEELPTRCIKAGSRPGDLVLDPFTGAGTTALVAIGLGRRFVGCELNPKYAAMARARVQRQVGILAAAQKET